MTARQSPVAFSARCGPSSPRAGEWLSPLVIGCQPDALPLLVIPSTSLPLASLLWRGSAVVPWCGVFTAVNPCRLVCMCVVDTPCCVYFSHGHVVRVDDD